MTKPPARRSSASATAAPESQIEVDTERANAMPDEQVRYAVEICPVGAILEKRVGFDVPIGRRKYEIESVRERALNPSDEAGAP